MEFIFKFIGKSDNMDTSEQPELIIKSLPPLTIDSVSKILYDVVDTPAETVKLIKEDMAEQQAFFVKRQAFLANPDVLKK